MFDSYSDRARQVILIALWSARTRGGSYIEPEDLLHAIIREDRGEFAAVTSKIFTGDLPHHGPPASFFSASASENLLRELQQDPGLLHAGAETPQPAAHFDMPISDSLKHILKSAARVDHENTKAIEPLHLLAGIVEDRDSTLAHLLRRRGITRQRVAKALSRS